MDKTIDPKYSSFYWQDGYGIFSVNPSEIQIVINYIKNQANHHNKKTFREELVTFLNKYDVDYNERFLLE